ncbi:MAG: hypothetical protein ACTH8P_10165 [Ewingella sp.]|uniref:hypothetical protein n=1 Tax=Ewingella sp. TaxID=1897459 RepID=UPI003F9216B9
MNKSPSGDLIFEINFNAHLARMTDSLNSRLDKFCCFIQVLLGASIFAQSGYGWLFGIIIAVISALQLAYKPGEAAGNAKVQALRYQQLADELSILSPEEIRNKRNKIEEQDTSPVMSLFNPARKRTSIAIYGKDVESEFELNFLERFVCFIAGGIPK